MRCYMKNKTVILVELSNTQRISLKHKEDSITILKEYRKDSSAEWITSKGIEIPKLAVGSLIEKLNSI